MIFAHPQGISPKNLIGLTTLLFALAWSFPVAEGWSLFVHRLLPVKPSRTNTSSCSLCCWDQPHSLSDLARLPLICEDKAATHD